MRQALIYRNDSVAGAPPRMKGLPVDEKSGYSSEERRLWQSKPLPQLASIRAVALERHEKRNGRSRRTCTYYTQTSPAYAPNRSSKISLVSSPSRISTTCHAMQRGKRQARQYKIAAELRGHSAQLQRALQIALTNLGNVGLDTEIAQCGRVEGC